MRRLLLSSFVLMQSAFLITCAFGENPVLQNCTVVVKNQLKIPAQDAGVLTELLIERGAMVQANQLLGKIDDTEAFTQQKVAEHALAQSEEQANSTFDIEFAVRAAEESEVFYQTAVDTNERQVKQGHNPIHGHLELRKRKLDWEKSLFSIELKKMEKRIAQIDVEARKAEVEAAKKAFERRSIVAPFAGQVVSLDVRKGEWVQPGMPILQLMDLKTLLVKGSVRVSDFTPNQLQGKPVEVHVTLANDQIVTLKGNIKQNIIPVLHGETYDVEAEVSNMQAGGIFVVPHGASAKMTILLE